MNLPNRLRHDERLWAALADREDALIAAGLPSGLSPVSRNIPD